MSEDRTTDQITADEAMAEAIRQVALAYGHLANSQFIGPFICVAAVTDVENPGATSYTVVHADGSQPDFVSLGLLEVGRQILRCDFDRTDDD